MIRLSRGLLLFLRNKDYTYLSTIRIMCCKYCVHLTMTYTLLHTTYGFYAYIKSFCDDMMVWVIVVPEILAHNLLKIFFNTFNSFPFCMFRFAFMTSSLPFLRKFDYRIRRSQMHFMLGWYYGYYIYN